MIFKIIKEKLIRETITIQFSETVQIERKPKRELKKPDYEKLDNYIQETKWEKCWYCSGSGYMPPVHPKKTCVVCNVTGEIPIFFHKLK